MDDGEDAELARLDWIVWTLEVRDPEQRTAPDIGERTEQGDDGDGRFPGLRVLPLRR
jgi:hypothetical protein